MLNTKVFLYVFALLLSVVTAEAQTAYSTQRQEPQAATEKYDVPNLQKLIGQTSIIPFFHPKLPVCWYVFNNVGEERQYYGYHAGKGKKLLYDPEDVKRLLEEMGVESNHVFYNPEFGDTGIIPVITIGNNKYIYDIDRSALEEYKGGPRYQRGPFGPSPDGSYIAELQDHNLYIRDLRDSTLYQLTTNGTADCGYVPMDLCWVSDSGFYLTRTDTRGIRRQSLVHTTGMMPPSVSTFDYEMSGDSVVTSQELYVGDATTRAMVRVDAVKWKDQQLRPLRSEGVKNRVYFLREKRTCDIIELCYADVPSGKVTVLVEEVSKPYINKTLVSFNIINGGKDIIVWSDRTGWGHFYRYDANGKLMNQITKGDWTAGEIKKIDEKQRQIYFYGYGREAGRNPNLPHLYRVDFDGHNLRLLTPEDASHNVFISDNLDLIIDNFSRIDMAPKSVVRDRNGNLLTILEEPDISKLLDYGWRMPEPFTVKAADGTTDLYGIMWKPYDFDPSKKYPIISQVYPGPFTETVWTDFTVFDRYNNTALAQRGFIVVCFGHRGGSPYRNKEYATYGYGNMRDYPLADDKCGLEQLIARHSFIDGERIGIFGHSGGGLMAATAMCTYPDFYKVAVASAGNYDNNIYFRSWGELYNGISEDNKFEVKTTMDIAGNLQGKILLVAGEVDQNVLPANTYRLMNAFILHDKDFDLLILPGQGHSYEGVAKSYFERRKRDYFSRYLRVGK